MSWQQYVDESLLGTKFVTKAAIHGLNDGQKWATTPGFDIQPKEVEKLKKAFTNPEDLYSSGLHVAGTRFVYLRHNGGHAIYGRKGSDSGVCICRTGQALIVGFYDGGIQPGSCNSVVEKLADYLRERQC